MSLYSKPMTEVATEIPRCFSISIQSDLVAVSILLDLTAPAVWIAPPNSKSFSVKVVFPASGWAMMAKVLRFLISSVKLMGIDFQRAKVRKMDLRIQIYDLRRPI